ncbi:MAG: putative isochorismatase-like hydrolase [Nocardioidaceae bacterium]|nr:putative isochorismatase-like hydrolase [Nocardioidaceae bacterium]
MTEGDPWLVAIDLQRVFAEPPSPWASPRFAEILPRVRDLVTAYDGRVVFTRFVPRLPPDGSWADYYAQWPFALDPATSYDLVLDPGDAPVVSRPTMGKYGAELLAATGGSRNLVLCGVSTDCCVLSTALAAADNGAWVRVVRDACAGASDEDHERSLAAMAFYAPQIAVVSASAV